MSKPTNPTLTSICTEALRKTGIGTPSGTLLTRAENEWMEEIKNDIMNSAYKEGSTKFITLSGCNQYQVTTIGLNRYSFPTNFLEEELIELLDGTHTDTATAGGNTNITLADDEDAGETDLVGKKILILSGTGSVDARRCIAYSTTTKIATIASAWSTNPDETSVYLVVDTAHTLTEQSLIESSDKADIFTTGRPQYYYKHCDRVNNYFYFDRPPDKSTYGIHYYYYINLHEIDLVEDTTLISRLYQNWHQVFVAGIYFKALEDADDDRVTNAFLNYERAKKDLITRECLEESIFNGFSIDNSYNGFRRY